MDAKRSQSLRKVATPLPSKSKMSKTKSQASITPSQVSEQTGTNSGNKNPLDPLSHATLPPIIERRSGLQDVDEEYYKNFTFPLQNPQKYDQAAGKRPETMQSDLGMNRQQAGGSALQGQSVAHQMNAAHQQHQQEIPQQHIYYTQAAGEPEMCTTCPHCQTVIYLARSDVEWPMGNNAQDGLQGQPDGSTKKL